MNIAIFTDLYSPWTSGGIVSSISAQKTELERLGHQVTIFCPGFNAREKGVVTVPTHKFIKINGAPLAMRPPKIEEFILQKYPQFSDFDIVHVHYEAGCSLAGVRLAMRFGVPLVQTMHGREDMAIAINVPFGFRTFVARVLNGLHRRYLPHALKIKRDRFQAPAIARAKMWELMVNQAEYADVVLSPSQHFAHKLEHYGVTKPIDVVSNGVSAALMSGEPVAREMEDGDVLKMVWNSRVSKEKRIDEFLRAVSLLERPYVLHVYGDGNMLKKCQRFAKRNQLKVKFYGKQKREKIIQRMQEAHLAVTASYNFDTQGMVLLEAEAVGLPVFFCDPEMAEIVPAESYILAGAPDAVSMSIALENFPAEKINVMSKKMLKSREKVSQAEQGEALIKVYQKIVR